MLGSITLAQAIARVENVNPSYNNPGALTWAPSSYCQLGKQGQLVVFCTPDDGQAALDNQIQVNVNRGLNLNTFFGGNGSYPGYSPAAAGNNPGVYANTVAGEMGIDTGTPLSNVDLSLLLWPKTNLNYTGADGSGAMVVDSASLLSADGNSLDTSSYWVIGLGVVLGIMVVLRLMNG